MFDWDYSDAARLPSPWQLRNKILIKNKKLISEPTQLYYNLDKNSNIGDDIGTIMQRKQSRSSFDSRFNLLNNHIKFL